MKINNGYFIVGLIIAFTLFFELAAHADEADQSTTITFSAPIQVPGQVLPAGSYLFKLVNRDSDLNTGQIFNSDRTVLYATFETIPTQRAEPAGDTVVALAEQGGGQPVALLKWFYPGNEIGHELVHPTQTVEELAHDQQEAILTNQHTMHTSHNSGASN